MGFVDPDADSLTVALRKESVDRKMICLPRGTVSRKSLSARRAWIEKYNATKQTWSVNKSLSARRAWIEKSVARKGQAKLCRRSPQGERG